MYLNPLNTSCCTLNTAFMLNSAPSLIVKGLVLRFSREGTVRSMTMLGRPLTSRVRDWMMQRRGSEGSEAVGPVEMPRDAFHFARIVFCV
jgi:hypothetical protein